MVEALVTYFIVSVAAVWVLWSILLPARLRRAIRRRLAKRTGVVAAPTRVAGCEDTDCPWCDLYD